MATKVVFLLALLGVASSTLPHKRHCDPVRNDQIPTTCSNYENILYLDNVKTEIEKKQLELQKRLDSLEGKTSLQIESANSTISALESLVTNLSSALKDLETAKLQTEMEFKDTKAELEKHKADIASLKKEVRDLVKHKERTGQNISEIEKKLESTERQLSEKKAKLENLETETEAAFNYTQRLLNVYKNELSHLNTTAQELEDKVEAQLDASNTELEAKLMKIQNDSEAFSAKLNEQKAEVDQFKGETEHKFSKVDGHLKKQKNTVDMQKAEIDTLKNDTAEIKTLVLATEENVAEQNKLKLEVNRIKDQVDSKVAFSATIIESNGVFTGPASNSNLLIFDRVFTNIGNAYNSETGIFTAPLKGVYHFSFMTFGYSSHSSGAILVKNRYYQVSTWEFTGSDVSDTTSNTVILELNVGETVNIILWQGGKIHTSVFTGFLIFQIP